jgi:deoxyribodipyrimidine photo-lyase
LALMPQAPWYGGLEDAWRPGETAAWQRLRHFCAALLDNYPHTRNQPGIDGVSRLSPHLHFGEISPRQIWHTLAQRVTGNPLGYPPAETFLRELGWREFAHYVLFYWPETPEQPMQTRFANYPWRRDYDELLAAWQQGRTGYPLVDAGMRELWHTGWMHNRVRMLVASWLVKNCRIPWQEGERWFWDTLVDADLANNALGWQWTAGCGTDAAPYFRIFNPVRQSEQFDPDGTYIRRWVPELSALPKRWLHQPWELPRAEQHELGFTPGRNYPEPTVDFARSRAEALAGFAQIKNR